MVDLSWLVVSSRGELTTGFMWVQAFSHSFVCSWYLSNTWQCWDQCSVWTIPALLVHLVLLYTEDSSQWLWLHLHRASLLPADTHYGHALKPFNEQQPNISGFDSTVQKTCCQFSAPQLVCFVPKLPMSKQSIPPASQGESRAVPRLAERQSSQQSKQSVLLVFHAVSTW